MSWSTELFCSIHFNRETYNSRYEVEDRLDEVKEQIETCKQSLRDLAMMTEPEKFYDKEDYNSPYDFVHRSYNQNIELLQELTIDEWKLEQLLYNWDRCHNEKGLAINPPKEIEWNTAYLEGDFVATVDHPNPNEL